ncbi:lactate utilization protein [Marinifilum fragile]|uniref:lactate utilization protein n=1 Tax=Marinifilum fragile TaxID=570161 RepID=UPI002AA70CC2|nr:lactate utilization protein [Marinifilum fragile]
MDLLVKAKEQLERNNFEVYISDSSESAYHTFIEEILPTLNVQSVSYGDSKTMHETGVIDYIKTCTSYQFIDTFNTEDSWREQILQRKRALTADLFLTGSNAITETGCLVNLDMIGNRIAALTFGPRYVVLFVGKNKIVKDLEAARKRVKEVAAIKNAKSHKNLNIPCQKTGKCMDCSSPHRICNSWTITEKSYPKNRIKIVLINEDLGY